MSNTAIKLIATEAHEPKIMPVITVSGRITIASAPTGSSTDSDKIAKCTLDRGAGDI